jgi:hypothetical protein
VTSQGSASARFQRAVAQRNLFAAEIAAKEMGGLSLIHALDFLELLAETKPERLERAALRWHGRLELEAPTLTMGEAQLALAALAQLPKGDAEVRAVLRRLPASLSRSFESRRSGGFSCCGCDRRTDSETA